MGGEYVDLNVPADSQINVTRPNGFDQQLAAIDFEGSAPLIAVNLYTDDFRSGDGPAFCAPCASGGVVQFSRIAEDLRATFAPTDGNHGTGTLAHDGEALNLPAGDYRLYLISDGSPATVSITIDGLDGAVTYAPGTSAELDYGFMEPSSLTPSLSPVPTRIFSRSAGGEGSTDEFLLIGQRGTQALDRTYNVLDLCFYFETPPPEIGDLAFAHGCPGLSVQANGFRSPNRETHHVGLNVTARAGADAALGGQITTPEAPPSGYALSYSLDIADLADRP